MQGRTVRAQLLRFLCPLWSENENHAVLVVASFPVLMATVAVQKQQRLVRPARERRQPQQHQQQREKDAVVVVAEEAGRKRSVMVSLVVFRSPQAERKREKRRLANRPQTKPNPLVD